jgi:hypothetical protein
MKKLKKGDIVTPKKVQNLRGNWHSAVNRTSLFQEYRVTRTDKECLFIIDDWGNERMCYANDWELIQREPQLELLTAFVLIVTVLFASAVVVASYLFEGI